jgi:nucleoside-diphosphate-sugar epimerase
MATTLTGKKILVTGPTGQVALPITLALAKENDVTGVARFSDAKARERLESAGVNCVALDLATTDFADLPSDYDYVLNLAVTRGGDADFDRDLAANGESLALLMQHCQDATAFLHCSSTAVYQPAGSHALKETDPLGDNHRVMMPTYSLAKIAAEVVARAACRQFDLPTVITRLNVPYGDNGGWMGWHLEAMIAGYPVQLHSDRPNLFNPIHEDDIIRMVPALLDAAGVPATIVNWGGIEAADLEEWCTYLGGLVGHEATFVETDATIGGVTIDTTKMVELIGGTEVAWRDGLRRMVDARTA